MMRRRAMVYEVSDNMPLLQRVWMTFEVPSFSRAAWWYAQFSLTIITLSTVSFCLESEINCKPFSINTHAFVTEENCSAWESTWRGFEIVAVTCFTLLLDSTLERLERTHDREHLRRRHGRPSAM